MKAYTLLNLISILVLKTIADDFCQTNLDGGEICEGGTDKNVEVREGFIKKKSLVGSLNFLHFFPLSKTNIKTCSELCKN